MSTKNNNLDLQETLLFICMQNTNFISLFFLRIYTLKNSAVWLVESILAHKHILASQRFVVKYK